MLVAVAATFTRPSRLAAQQGDPHASPLTLSLADGTVLIARLIAQDSLTVTLQSDLLGRVVIPRAAITAGLNMPVPTPEVAPPPMPPMPSSPPMPAVEWARTIRLGFNYASPQIPGSVGETKGAALSVALERRSSQNTITIKVDAEYQHTDPDATTVDESTLSVADVHQLRGPFSLRSEGIVEHDAVDELDYRLFGTVGIEWKAVNGPRYTLVLAPGFGYVEEHGDGPANLNGVARQKFKNAKGAADGLFESMAYRPAPGFSVEQEILGFHAFDGSPALQYNAVVRVVGMVTKHVGMTIEYKREFDSTIPYPISQLLERITAGIQIAF